MADPESDHTTDEPERCLVCAYEREDCWSCDGGGDDGYDDGCWSCEGSGQVVPDHCCDCGGSPYCVRCHTCGASCAADCRCPIPLLGFDGEIKAVL